MMRTVCRASAGFGTCSTEAGGRSVRDVEEPRSLELIVVLLRATDGSNEGLQFSDQFGVKVEVDLLLAIAPGFRRVGMDLDEQAVRVERNRCLAQFQHHVGASAALARVDDDG